MSLLQRCQQALTSFWKPLIAVVALVALILWTSGVFRERMEPDITAHQPGFALPANSPLHTVEQEAFGRRINLPGSVTPEHAVDLRARLQAHVRTVSVGAGQTVQEGDALITLDDRELSEQVDATQAHLQQAEAEHHRARRLFEAQATTQQALTAAESAHAAARAEAERANTLLSHARILSPIDGIVIDRFAEVGDLAQPGQPLLRLYNPDAMRLDVPVPVRLMDRVPPGSEHMLSLEGIAEPLTGQVTEIVAEVDPTSRTRMVKIRFTDDAPSILPGTFGRLQLDSAPQPGIRIPATAVYRAGQLEMVQVAKDNRVIRRLIRTGAVIDGWVEALSGLDAGESILIQPILEVGHDD